MQHTHMRPETWDGIRRYGFFKNKRIVLYDTLIEQCKEPEVVAVLAHELGMSPAFRLFMSISLIGGARNVPSTMQDALHTREKFWTLLLTMQDTGRWGTQSRTL